MIHDDEPHTRTIVYGARRQPFVRRSAEERTLVAERQLAAAQVVAASLQARLGEAQREIMACQTELDAERAVRQVLEAQLAALHADLAAERDAHALTEALRVHERQEAQQIATQAAGQIAWIMRKLAAVGAERIKVDRALRSDEENRVDDPDARGGGLLDRCSAWRRVGARGDAGQRP